MKLSPSSAQKIKTYVGFACKARKCVLGVDNIIKVNKPMLVLYSSELDLVKLLSQKSEYVDSLNEETKVKANFVLDFLKQKYAVLV